jgi:cyclopropane fatty-acyl-phospholipid synthase-like methyltransferase
MGSDDAQVWNKTWSGAAKTTFDFNTRVVFKNIRKEVSFEGKKVLELGCGSGRLSYLACQAGAKELTLVDFSDAALRRARGLFKGISHVSFVKANLLDFNSSPKYDIVFSSGVLEHFKGQELLLATKVHVQCSRQYVAIVVPSDTGFNARRSLSPKNIKLYGYQKPISPEQMKGLFEEANVSITAMRKFHFMYGVPILSRFCGYRLRKLGALAAFVLKPLDKSQGGLLLAVGRVQAKN